MQDLGTLGGPGSTATAINTSGEVVGIADLSSGFSHAFLWYNGVMQDLDSLGEGNSEAQAISRNGLIAGESQTTSGAWHAFLWDAGIMLDLGTLPGDVNSYAFGVNDDGHIAGASYAADGSFRGIFWENGVMEGLDAVPGYPDASASAINANDEIVGFAEDPSLGMTNAVLWENGTAQDIGSSIGIGSGNLANGINRGGNIVGAGVDFNFVRFGYKLSNGKVVDLNNASGVGEDVVDTAANAIDNQGDITGYADLTDGNTDAALWTGGVFQDIGTLGGPVGAGYGVIHEIKPVAAPPTNPPVQLQPTQVTAAASALTPNADGNAQTGTITLTNIGTSNIAGPIQLIFATLPSGVTLAHETGDLFTIPYLTVPVPDGLGAGQSIVVPVKFKDPSNATVTYTLELYSGNIN